MRKPPQAFYDGLLIATMVWLNVSTRDYITAFVTGAIVYHFATRFLVWWLNPRRRAPRGPLGFEYDPNGKIMLLDEGTRLTLKNAAHDGVQVCTRPDWPHDSCNGWPCDDMLERIETEGKIRARFGPREGQSFNVGLGVWEYDS